MATSLLTERNVWKEISKDVIKIKTKSFVAVAYFGKGAADRLPLRKGSILLVNACEFNIRSKVTCPAELIKLYKKGVFIYSLDNLHAKVFVIGMNAYIGSSNVSDNSAVYYAEAAIKTNDKKIVTEAKRFIESNCGTHDMGLYELERLDKIYQNSKARQHIPVVKRKPAANSNSFFVYHFENITYTPEEKKESEKGRAEANKKFSGLSRHTVDEFIWDGKFSAKPDDTILQITDEGKSTLVSPPGKLIHVRKWNNGRSSKLFCYVEIPNKKRKNLKFINKKLISKEKQTIKRNGKKSKALQNKILGLWN